MDDDPVIQIVRGQATDEECAAVVAVLTAALHRASLAAAGLPLDSRPSASWDGDLAAAYYCPRSWRSNDRRVAAAAGARR
jgi:hypothetical protein